MIIELGPSEAGIPDLIKYEAGRTERTKSWGSLSFRSDYRKHSMWPASDKWAGRPCMQSLLGHKWSLDYYFDFDDLEKSSKPLQSSSFLCKMGIEKSWETSTQMFLSFLKTPGLWLIQSLNELKHTFIMYVGQIKRSAFFIRHSLRCHVASQQDLLITWKLFTVSTPGSVK